MKLKPEIKKLEIKPKIKKLETKKLDYNLFYGSFNIFPLNVGQGLTLGNSLRRVLLSEIIGTAITGFEVKQFPETGSFEDEFSLSLNLKDVVLKTNIIKKSKAYLKVKGPQIITASLIQFPKHLNIINPNHYLCTINNEEFINIELDIYSGKGALLSEEIEKNNKSSSYFSIDSFFSPIRRINYSVNIDSYEANLKENLFIEIFTNGSITPYRSLKEAIKNLTKLYSNLLI